MFRSAPATGTYSATVRAGFGVRSFGIAAVLGGASMMSVLLACPMLYHDAQPAYSGAGWSQGDGGAPDIEFPASNVELLAWLPVWMFGSQNTSANTVEGFVTPGGREIAVIGLSAGTGFVNVTDPGKPNIIAFIPGVTSMWRDIQVYGQRVYTVSEGGAGVQVIDVSNIDNDVVTLVGTFNTPSGTTAATHTMFINKATGHLFRCGGGSNGLRMYDLNDAATPGIPVYKGAWTTNYVHECQVVSYTEGPYAGKEIAFCFTGNSDGMHIVDVTNLAAPVTMSFVTYPSAWYCHQGWLSEDRQYMYINDELDEQNLGYPTRTRIIDVSDLANPEYVTDFGNGAGGIDHNLYTLGNRIFEANYRTGLRVFDATIPTAPTEIAYFDTYPANNNANFNGLWDNYPYLPSGIVLGADIEKGLFVWSIGPTLLDFAFPQGRPELLNPVGDTVAVTITPNGAALEPGTARLNYDTGSGVSSVALTPTGGNGFAAEFPALPCGTLVRYFFSAQTTDGATIRSPAGAPASAFDATVASELTVGFADAMETNTGWTVAPVDSPAATSGLWVRVDPNFTAAQSEDDNPEGTGTLCWVTGNGTPGGSASSADVDGGTTTLTSPTLDAMQGDVPYIEYYRWYSNNTGSAPNADSMPVELSNDNGATWVQLELVTENVNAWKKRSFKISDFLVPTSQMQVRFKARDLDSASVIEAGVDDVRITYYNCSNPQVPGDITGDGLVAVDDLLAVINAWGACPVPPSTCDPDIAPDGGDGLVNVEDLLFVINNWG